MNIPIFMSVSTPYLDEQKEFLKSFEKYMDKLGLQPRTVGRTDYGIQEPLISCRMVMMECFGLVTLAFRRFYVKEGYENYDGTTGESIAGSYITSPWCHIEAAMAFQMGLPILIFREEGVLEKGLLSKGITNTYLPTFDLSASDRADYFDKDQFKQVINQWSGYVRAVREKKGTPPRLYRP